MDSNISSSTSDVIAADYDYDPVTGELAVKLNDSLLFVEYQIPFCAPFTSNRSLSNASLWTAMPDSCRRSLEVLTAVMALCSVLTTVFNIAVLISSLSQNTRRMRRRNPTMLNYSNYVISMAMADLLMGLVILPMTVAFMSVELIAEKPWMVARNGGHMGMERHLASSTGLRNTIGVLTHIALFASLYTIAAASVDRFYTSSQPFTNGSLRISRSSIRRSVLRMPAANRAAAAAQEEHGFNVTRSVVVLVAIWGLSTILSLTPLIMTNLAMYRHVGHIFVVIVSPMRFNIGVICYTIFLALPLIITWIFSVLVCLSLWRRRIRLNSSSSSVHNTPSAKSSFNEKHTHMMAAAHRRRFERTAECSTTEERREVEGATCLRHPSDSEALSDDSCSDMDVGGTESMLKSAGNGAGKRRTFVTVDPTALKRLYMSEKRYLSPHHAFDDSNVAKHMLYRRSWSGYPFDTSDNSQSSGDSGIVPSQAPRAHARLQASLSSPVRDTPRVSSISKTNRNFSTSSLTKAAPNSASAAAVGTATTTTPRPDSAGVHPAFQRQQPMRNSRRRNNQRQSSVRIARNMLRSRSMELGIAKTLLTVVLTFTVITAPIIVVMSLKLTRGGAGGDDVSKSELNAEASALVVSIMLLFSNSLWNSMIYGARMPYFRHMVKRVCRYFAENPALTGCCGKADRVSMNLCRKINCGKLPTS